MPERKERQLSSPAGFLSGRDSNFIERNDPPHLDKTKARTTMGRGWNKAAADEERIYKKGREKWCRAIFSGILKITLRERVTLFWNRNAKTLERKSDRETIHSRYAETDRDVELVKGGWRDKKMSTDQGHSPRKVKWNFFLETFPFDRRIIQAARTLSETSANRGLL